MKAQWLIAVVVFAGCQNHEVVSEFTGNQASYGLVQASQYAVSGTVTFKERKDGATTVLVQLQGTDGTAQLPVHLHMGDVTSNGAAIAAVLSPASGKTGASETVISQLADQTKVSYKDLLKISAYINVHASGTGPESAVILAAGNIGTNGTKVSSSARIGVCSNRIEEVKKNLSILFLLVLSLPAIYKVGFFTFYQLNKDYIAENYCVNKDRPITMCYGSCFLEKGLNMADQAPNPESLASTLKFEIQEFLVDDIVIPKHLAETIFTFSFLETPSIPEGFHNAVFRPPLA